MPVSKIALLLINLNTFDHPIYKAECINGFGSGVGNTEAAAIDHAKKNICSLLHIYHITNISLDLITKEDYMLNNSPEIHGLSSWNSSSFQWIEFEVDELDFK